jgi:hypothetical protein
LKARLKDWEELNPQAKPMEVMVWSVLASMSAALAKRRSRMYVPMGLPTTAEKRRWK